MKNPGRSNKTGPKKAPKEHNKAKMRATKPQTHRPSPVRRAPTPRNEATQEAAVAGPTEKAYKLLAAQEGISNRDAKELIDRGVVYAYGKKVLIARAEMKASTTFKIERPAAVEILFEDDDLVAVNKPAFVDSEEVSAQLGLPLINRLDKETSGVMLLAKNEPFREKAIAAFRKKAVYKEYAALVGGMIAEEVTIDQPIRTIKGTKAKSLISKNGVPALTEVSPVAMAGGKTKVKAVIHTGRTHQIRVHLSSIDHPIVGDSLYGGMSAKRMMLHSKKIELLGYSIEAAEPAELANFG